jgi:glutaredoxin 3
VTGAAGRQATLSLRDNCIEVGDTRRVPSRVILFSTDACAFCGHAKSLLTKRGVAFEEVNLGPHPELQAELAEVTGLDGFPQIIVDGEPLGGLNELRAADGRGALAAWSGGPSAAEQ